MHAWMTGPHAPPNDATVGQRILVNGQFAPYLTVKPGLYRLRLLNASLFSAYDFALSDGSAFTQIGTGSGLLPAPVTRQDVLLGPAQRADVVVDFRGKAGQDILLNTIPRSDATGPAAGTGSRNAALMQFRVRGTSSQKARVPGKLRPLAPLKGVPGKVSKTWTFDLSKSRPRVVLVDQRQDVQGRPDGPPGPDELGRAVEAAQHQRHDALRALAPGAVAHPESQR